MTENRRMEMRWIETCLFLSGPYSERKALARSRRGLLALKRSACKVVNYLSIQWRAASQDTEVIRQDQAAAVQRSAAGQKLGVLPKYRGEQGSGIVCGR